MFNSDGKSQIYTNKILYFYKSCLKHVVIGQMFEILERGEKSIGRWMLEQRTWLALASNTSNIFPDDPSATGVQVTVSNGGVSSYHKSDSCLFTLVKYQWQDIWAGE